MTAEHWQRLSAIFHRALQQPLEGRQAFLDEECAGDRALRRDVERMLVAHENAGDFDLALNLNTNPPLAVGSSIGPYRVIELIGVGGMGEVYRARDERLGRDVAIKVLPREFTNDAGRLARVEREARALAALNHPNIATIHGLEDHAKTRALVMELIDGEMLSSRIEQARTSRHALPLEEILTIARQIAAALDAAHERGIVHRDLKPSNVKITSSGAVKVLDFGLAKAMEHADEVLTDAKSEPAAPLADLTNAGVVMGTVAYMSPEQARGLAVDRRSDVWSFGCVLYEMLTGANPFAGQDARDTVSRILRHDPDLTALPLDTPAGVRRLLTLCLEKDRARRLANIAVAAYEIDTTLQADETIPSNRPRRLAKSRLAVASSVAALLGATVVWIVAVPRGPTAPHL